MTQRLYWLEYSSAGGPLAPVADFEDVGFEVVEIDFFGNYDDLSNFVERSLLKIEESQAHLVLFFILNSYISNEIPFDKLIELCQNIRKSSKLQHTKLMGLFNKGTVTMKQETICNHHFDFFAQSPFKLKEYARTAKGFFSNDKPLT